MAASLKRKSLSEPKYPEVQIPENIKRFSMSQIAKVTDNFHSRNFIGGGYGPV
jgi:interleukin-1 receptor-associated kinase 1